MPQEFVAVNDSFGESGTPDQLMEKYGLNSTAIIEKSRKSNQTKIIVLLYTEKPVSKTETGFFMFSQYFLHTLSIHYPYTIYTPSIHYLPPSPLPVSDL